MYLRYMYMIQDEGNMILTQGALVIRKEVKGTVAFIIALLPVLTRSNMGVAKLRGFETFPL